MKLKAPNALALIPDGNRRWARKHRLSVVEGYSLGVNRFIDFARWCGEYGVNSITVWALSSENLKRHDNEVKALFHIYKKMANDKNMLRKLKESEIRINIIANARLVPKDLIDSLHRMEIETMHYTKKVINMLIGYGGKDDILFAARELALETDPSKINKESFRKHLLSGKVPELDFIIRTSGEKRLSGFMPWQAGYAELYFSKKLWPDFTKEDLRLALLDYNRRNRRFGK